MISHAVLRGLQGKSKILIFSKVNLAVVSTWKAVSGTWRARQSGGGGGVGREPSQEMPQGDMGMKENGKEPKLIWRSFSSKLLKGQIPQSSFFPQHARTRGRLHPQSIRIVVKNMDSFTHSLNNQIITWEAGAWTDSVNEPSW